MTADSDIVNASFKPTPVKDGEVKSGHHPLETGWVFGYDRKSTSLEQTEEFANKLQSLAAFNTVEGFYSHYAYMQKADKLPNDVNVWMFRQGYKPMWEEFPDGGSWSVRCTQKGLKLDSEAIWERVLLALIGEESKCPNVCGCVLSKRSTGDVISIWTDVATHAVKFMVGQHFRSLVGGVGQDVLMHFKDFTSSMQDMNSHKRSQKYTFEGSSPKSNRNRTSAEGSAK